jgi:CheY-like chemotaxis protein
MDGWAFAAAYQQLPSSHAPILVMTAAYNSHSRAAEIAANGFIAKPFDLDHVVGLVRRHTQDG